MIDDIDAGGFHSYRLSFYMKATLNQRAHRNKTKMKAKD